MTTFPSADAAANAATRMHVAVEALPLVGATKLALRIGFHTGPVIRREDDLFGDTVNLASRIAGQAARGQVLMSEETAALLSPAVRSGIRALYAVELKGKAESVALCELVWRQSPDVTDLASGALSPSAIGRLWIKFRGSDVTDWDPTLRIGRDKECQVVVAGDNASRRHCTIERRGEKFSVRDHSTNGTYVTVDGEPEFVLHREEVVLRGHGWIACGEPRAQSADVIEYFCE
jgi:hypothetical protein